VPLLDIVPNASAQHGLSTNRQLGIAFGAIIGFAFLTGLTVFLYSVFYQRFRGSIRARSWKRQLSLRELYLNRGSRRHLHRRSNNSNDNRSASPDAVTIDSVATDPFALITFDFIPSREVPKPASSTDSKAMHPRRGTGWSNFEDYEYDD
jgi:hypothetical protein